MVSNKTFRTANTEVTSSWYKTATDLRKSGSTHREIARELNSMGYSLPHGGRVSAHSVACYFSNLNHANSKRATSTVQAVEVDHSATIAQITKSNLPKALKLQFIATYL